MRGTILLRDGTRNEWLTFEQPLEIIQADSPSQVLPALEEIEAWVNDQGGYAAGFLSYEAAPAFDPALRVRPLHDFPLLWFGLYQASNVNTADGNAVIPVPNERRFVQAASAVFPTRSHAKLQQTQNQKSGVRTRCQPRVPSNWEPNISRARYDAAIECVKDHIARGDTYQVNYTMRLHAPFTGGEQVVADEPWNLFTNLVSKQPNSYAAYLDMGRYVICSASPELFLRCDGNRMTMRPMKGTAPRGRFTREDQERADWLFHSTKNRAENVMIVDMVRNDLGRIADVGSVNVPRLYQIERYPTVWQMTSTVQATSDAPLVEILRATFPCASITGAPKVSTMRIIAELETTPRRVYTGAIGYLAPGRRAQFNVAIRTVLIDRERDEAEYGVGGGIVWDSEAGDEYTECLHKARVLTDRATEFSLIESLRWTPDEGYWLRDYHLRRLSDSADYFDFVYDRERVVSELERTARTLARVPHKIRLLMSREGTLTLTAAPIEAQPESIRLRLAPTPVDANNRFLFHKTTERTVYDAAFQSRAGADDVLLWNEREQVTETCTGNIVARIGGECFTPPLESGLLAGTLRAYLLDQGTLHERVIHIDELARCETLYRINSVRGWQRGVLGGR